MSIPNEPESENTELKQESYSDTNGNTHTHVTRTSETLKNNIANPNSYQKGYVQGRNTEHTNQQADLAERDNNNANGGLVLGIIITSVLALVIGGVWYFSQQNNAPVNNIVPVAVPVPSKSSSTPSASPQPRTTMIERTREIPVVVPVPVPQQQVTPSSPPRQPNINITVPPQQPAAEKAPVTQPTPKATQTPTTSPTSITPTSHNKEDTSTNTVAPGTKSDTSKTTPPQ
ncbi:MAG: hypothetical protein ACYTXA_05580 [Nostoc sp.]